jgi:hypothetical protein
MNFNLYTSKIKVLLTLFLLIIGIFGYCQTKTEKIELTKYQVRDTNLINIIDKFLQSEKICDYYSDSLKISIDICDLNGKIDSPCIDSDTLSISISSTMFDNVLFLNAIGYFFYQGHLFSICNVATEKLFVSTDSIMEFNYTKISYNKKTESSTSIPLIQLDDDSWTMWIYKFISGKLILESQMPNCPNRKRK